MERDGQSWEPQADETAFHAASSLALQQLLEQDTAPDTTSSDENW